MSQQRYRHAAENPSPHDHNDQTKLTEKNAADYWRANLRLLATLLVVWFAVSFGCGILLVDWLDQFTFFGFKLIQIDRNESSMSPMALDSSKMN